MKTEKTLDKLVILIVDQSDADANRMIALVEELGSQHVAVRTADVHRALELISQTPPDCILLDFHLLDEWQSAHSSESALLLRHSAAILVCAEESQISIRNLMATDNPHYLFKDNLTAFSMYSAIRGAMLSYDQQALLEQERLEQRAFLRPLLHDARVPFRHIRQSAQILAEEITRTDLADLLDIQKNAVLVADNLVDSLQTYSGLLKEITLQPVSLEAVWETAIDAFAQGEGVRIDKIGELPFVQGNQAELRLLLVNLIENGLKHNQSTSRQVSVFQARQSETGVIICVKDNGIGIAEISRLTVFNPFSRLYSEQKEAGTGLGLTLCKKIVRRHGGSIWCESTQDEGSEFYIELLKTAS